jgi:hypothetical protein
LALSEKQIPQVIEKFESGGNQKEALEPVTLRVKQALYQLSYAPMFSIIYEQKLLTMYRLWVYHGTAWRRASCRANESDRQSLRGSREARLRRTNLESLTECLRVRRTAAVPVGALLKGPSDGDERVFREWRSDEL